VSRRPSGSVVLLICVATLTAAAGCGANTRRETRIVPSKPRTLADVVASVRSGIVRIQTQTCDEEAVGTGFLISPRLVATVEHVVDGAISITLKQNGRTAGSARVVGSDASRDLALLETAVPLDGHTFAVGSRTPRLGEDVAALGFPLDLPLTVTRGTVSGTGRTVAIEGIKRHGLIQTDAEVNPGNSGGPLISVSSGNVVGLIDLKNFEGSGIGFAVSTRLAEPLISAWRAAPQKIASPSCSADVGQTSASGAQAPQPAGNSDDLTSFNGSYFSLTHPASWGVESAERSKGAYLDTTIRARSNSSVMLRVDVTPGLGGDPMTPARQVESALARQSGYQRIAFNRTTFNGYDAVDWEFSVIEDGLRLHKVDTFFINSRGDEFAVLTQAPDSSYSSLQSTFAAVRDSVVVYGG
jgi:S1-C subfamily serine protease